MGGQRWDSGCARGGGRRVSGYRRRLLGQWLSSAAARACAVAGGSYCLGYCRRRPGHGVSGSGWGLISFLSPFLSRCGFHPYRENLRV
nr:hypothetical protein CFP56_06297 [Quercus suber]